MGQISVEKPTPPGSVLSRNQRSYVASATTHSFGFRHSAFIVPIVGVWQENGICRGACHWRALRGKRSELAGMVNRLERELIEHRTSLTHLDAIMQLLVSDESTVWIGIFSNIVTERTCSNV